MLPDRSQDAGIFDVTKGTEKIDNLEPRIPEEIALEVMALLAGQASAEDDNATADAD